MSSLCQNPEPFYVRFIKILFSATQPLFFSNEYAYYFGLK